MNDVLIGWLNLAYQEWVYSGDKNGAILKWSLLMASQFDPWLATDVKWN